jgi:hypothetical protein
MDNLTLLALLKRLQDQVSDVTKQIGPQGPVGPQGPAGERGAEGIQGIRGPAGESGSDGIQGAPGFDGADGEDGKGIESVSQDADGDLIFHMTDGTDEIVSLPESLFGASTGDDTSVYVRHSGGSATPTKYTLVLSTPYVVNGDLLIDGHNIFGIKSGQDSQVVLPDDVPSEKVVVINNEMDNFTVTVSSAL